MIPDVTLLEHGKVIVFQFWAPFIVRQYETILQGCPVAIKVNIFRLQALISNSLNLAKSFHTEWRAKKIKLPLVHGVLSCAFAWIYNTEGTNYDFGQSVSVLRGILVLSKRKRCSPMLRCTESTLVRLMGAC